MTPHDDLIYALHGHAQFKFLVDALTRLRPVIPTHDPTNDNTDQWKQRSAQQAGFDLCLNVFKIHIKE